MVRKTGTTRLGPITFSGAEDRSVTGRSWSHGITAKGSGTGVTGSRYRRCGGISRSPWIELRVHSGSAGKGMPHVVNPPRERRTSNVRTGELPGAKRRITSGISRMLWGISFLQLRRTARPFFGLSPCSRRKMGAYGRAARASRFLLRLGLWPGSAVRRRDRRRWRRKTAILAGLPFLEAWVCVATALSRQLPPPLPLPRGRGTGRDLLLPRLHGR